MIYQIHFTPSRIGSAYRMALDGSKATWPVIACEDLDGTWFAQPEYIDDVSAPE